MKDLKKVTKIMIGIAIAIVALSSAFLFFLPSWLKLRGQCVN